GLRPQPVRAAVRGRTGNSILAAPHHGVGPSRVNKGPELYPDPLQPILVSLSLDTLGKRHPASKENPYALLDGDVGKHRTIPRTHDDVPEVEVVRGNVDGDHRLHALTPIDDELARQEPQRQPPPRIFHENDALEARLVVG